MKRSLPIPREHGAYIVLVSSWLIGLLYSSHPGWNALIAIALLLLALAIPEVARVASRERRKSSRNEGQDRLAIDSSCAILIATLTVGAFAIVLEPWILFLTPVALCIGYAILWLRDQRFPLSTISLVAFLGLALGAPLTALLCGTHDAARLALMWLMSGAFFIGSNMNVAVRLGGTDALQKAAGYHFIAIPLWILIAQNFDGFMPGLIGLGLNLLRFGLIAARPERFLSTRMKRIGFEEAALTTVFVALTALLV